MFSQKDTLRALAFAAITAFLFLGATPTARAAGPSGSVKKDIREVVSSKTYKEFKRMNSGGVPGDTYWSLSPGIRETGRSLSETAKAISLDTLDAASVKSRASAQAHDVPLARRGELKQLALVFGVQSGLAAEGERINSFLMSNASVYDKAFNFKALSIKLGLLPPVIVEARNTYRQPNSRVVRAADRLYKIVKPARLVGSAPTWRNYLWVKYIIPTLPQPEVLPEGSQEDAIWNHWVREGYQKGVKLARNTFRANNARLRRDFTGMVRYMQLYEQGVVSKPVMITSRLGVRGGGGEMSVGTRIYRLAKDSALNPDKDEWIRDVPVTAKKDIKR